MGLSRWIGLLLCSIRFVHQRSQLSVTLCPPPAPKPREPRYRRKSDGTPVLQEDSTHAHTQDEGDRPPSLLPEKGGKLHHLTEEGGSASTAVESAGSLQGPGELEAEADQQGAFDPETGEINWDCPCLGGMAHGPWYDLQTKGKYH